jgi:intracellular septation protein
LAARRGLISPHAANPKGAEMNNFRYALRYFAGDMVPMILFLVLFMATKNIILATGAGIAVGLAQVGYGLARRRPIGALQLASLGLVAVFGTMTLVTRDPRFIMFKPTAIQLILGAVMLRPGWMERYVPAEAREVARPLLTAFGFVWAGLMFLLAALNVLLVVAADPVTWARFHLFVPPVAIIGLFLIQYAYMRAAAARSGLAYVDRAAGGAVEGGTDRGF